jgi:AlkA N-terminal domain/HhH-GPD superfamily base excision DNA repair protein
LFFIERVRAMFDLNADWPIIVKTLQTDASLARWIAAEAGLRAPGCWNGFELTVRAILGHQVSVKAATTFAGRIVTAYGRRFTRANGRTHVFPDPEILAEANLNRVGLTSARAESIRALARAVCDKRIRFEGIVDYDEFRAGLCEISRHRQVDGRIRGHARPTGPRRVSDRQSCLAARTEQLLGARTRSQARGVALLARLRGDAALAKRRPGRPVRR